MTLASVILDGKVVDVQIERGIIIGVTPHNESPLADGDIDGRGLSVYPGLHNMHTHSPMVLFRGLGDDQPLDRWLNQYIWPAERELTDERVYEGSLQACREMASTGTTYFNDMYFRLPAMARAVEESGLRGRLGLNIFGDALELDESEVKRMLCSSTSRVSYSIAPHSVYTVSTEGLLRCARACREWGLPMHIHMSETEKEVTDCIAKYGCRPWELLERIGVLDMVGGTHIIAAHCLHLSPHEIDIIGSRGITCVHCPNSNLKLGSGYRFPLTELLSAGATVRLGTDGSASSNNLDMIEVMKVSALLQKGWRGDPTAAPASLMMTLATGGHTIAAGEAADLFLVDADSHSNLVYATHGESVQLTMVDGRVVWQR
ncbi:MAG: amidohydrolase [Bacteroidales bacterium]|nr:amidohydrolase [Bacteroidales bacterium]